MIEIIPNWHPILVHFTIALLSTSVGLFVLATILSSHRWRDQWLNAANWNLWVGTSFAILTVLAGWYAYNTVAHDTPSHEAMTIHRNWALVTLVVFLLIAGWSVVIYRAGKKVAAPFLVAAVVGAGLLMTTGWLGAEAVYRYGLGVMSLPQSDGDGHAHEHADGEGHGHDDTEKAGMEKDRHDGEEPHGHAEGEGHGHDSGEKADEMVKEHHDEIPHGHTDNIDMPVGEKNDEPAVKESVKSAEKSSKTHHDDGHDHEH